MAGKGAERRRSGAPQSDSHVGLKAAEGWARIDQPHRVARVLEALANEGAVGRFVHAPLAHVELLPCVKRGALRLRYDGPALDQADIEVASTHALYRIALGPTGGGGIVDVPFPAAIERRSARRERRVAAPTGVFFCFHDAAGFLQRRAVVDVSNHGLGFRPLPRDLPIEPGAFADAFVDWGGDARVGVSFDGRASRELPGTGEMVLGGRLTPATAKDGEEWTTRVEAILYPNTRKASNQSKALWDLYSTSGYFHLSGKTPPAFAPLEPAHSSVLPRLVAEPELAIQILWPSSRGVEAAVTGALPYGRAAFLYQLARRPGTPPEGSPKQLLREGYMRALEWVELRESVEWLIIWVQDAGGRISKELHLDFGLRHDDGVIGCVRQFHVLELPSNADSPNVAGVTVRDAVDREFDRIASEAASRLPPAYVAAHMLRADELAGARFPLWRRANVRRERRVLVAERDGSLVAAAVVTLAEEGVHLYRLFDLVEVIPFGGYDEAAVEGLLAEASRWYANAGVGAFVFACDAEVSPSSWPRGATDLGLTHCTVVTKKLLPELVEDVWLVTAGD